MYHSGDTHGSFTCDLSRPRGAPTSTSGYLSHGGRPRYSDGLTTVVAVTDDGWVALSDFPREPVRRGRVVGVHAFLASDAHPNWLVFTSTLVNPAAARRLGKPSGSTGL